MRTILLLLIALAATAGADELVGDRPDFTESAATVEPGRFQLEAGVTVGEADGVDTVEAGEVLLRIGLDAATEVRLGLGSWTRVDDGLAELDGVAGVEVGFKRALSAGGGNSPALALIGAVALPTGAEGLGPDSAEPAVILAAEWTLADAVGLGTNFGWTRAGSGGDRYSSAWMSAALGFALAERTGFFVELYGFDKEERDGDATLWGDAGFTHLVSDGLQLDVRVGAGLDGADDATYLGLGVIRKF